MTARTDRARLWGWLALLAVMVAAAAVVLTWSERRSRPEEQTAGPDLAGAGDLVRPAEPLPVGPLPVEPLPVEPLPRHADPFGFDWDPFGEDWDQLFPDHWRLGGRAGIDPDHPVQREFDRIREEMREEMRRQREVFRGRMATPDPIPPRRPSRPTAPEGSSTKPAFDVVRLSLPDAVVLLVKVADLIEGTLEVKMGEGQVTVAVERRAPDGETHRHARTVPLSESIDPEGVEVRRVEGGYRVVLPVR